MAKLKNCFLGGLTGSIGQNTCSVLAYLYENHNKAASLEKVNRYRLVGFSVKSRVADVIAILQKLLAGDGEKESFLALKTVAVSDAAAREKLKAFFKTVQCLKKVVVYERTELALADSEADVFINALSGSSGLEPTICALTCNMRILLANKESLVMGGSLIKTLLAKRGETIDEVILPIDSEHKAIQTLSHGWRRDQVAKLILTASGGPFWENELADPTPEQALAHPNWNMGAKISIDSATMMNKALEIIEAHVLFSLPYKQISAIIHKEQVVHAFLELTNGECLALLGANDMRYAIQGSLTYPELMKGTYKPFNLTDHANLTFQAIPKGRYPLFELACVCGEKGGAWPILVNAANEACVEAFLARSITFNQISTYVAATLERYEKKNVLHTELTSLAAIMELHNDVKRALRRHIAAL
ncbi:1-deoxy-D-xylulose 5-phosphate reductoisomerase [Spirochaetota bacterium]|nr:1-deoxy-D-xylulose 5-phosphate reductoisomerase [Spirochaetota bacterium]